ncbi:MAG TPA: DUF349 domain-containing protein, partial [Bacteroidales bacterium]|nr:DUF349 domain-containing protein [Bacteroidales bacterium]
MENNKTVDQNPEQTVNPEENTQAAKNAAKETDVINSTEIAVDEPELKDAEAIDPGLEPESESESDPEPQPEPEPEPETSAVQSEVIEEATEIKKSEEIDAADAVEPAAEPEAELEEPASPVEDDQDEDADNDDGDDDVDEEEEVEEAFEEFGAEELVSRLEDLVKADEISSIKTKVALIKVAFLKILKEEKQLALKAFLDEGGKEEDFTPEESKLEKRYNKAFDIYRKNRQKFNEQQEKVKLENLERKKEILEKLKDLISSEETLKKTYDEFRALQTEWKEVGMVPSGEVSNLWQSYHFLVEKFFDKVKINKELRDLDMKKNLELKVELCEKTEELLLETSIIKSFKQLQKFHEEWKEIGPVPQEQSDEIWERFKAATDKINERRREHYGQLQEEQENNLLAKTGLCEQMEELVAVVPDSMKGWQDLTQ